MDLSPSNVLVNPNYMTQLIDFGESYHEKVCGRGKFYKYFRL
jgi:Ser/Thr protein kinase RdoA (MazF antagonist)